MLLMFFFHYKSETDNAFLIFAQKYCYCLIFQSDGGLKNEKPKLFNAFQHWRACLGRSNVISAGNLALKIFPLDLLVKKCICASNICLYSDIFRFLISRIC